jgi:hypothetical protein
MAQKVDVRFVPIESVYQWKNNPWKHEAKIPELAVYLAINGQKSPVEVWSKNKVIYKGNHTQKALIYLGKNIDAIAKEIGQSVDEVLERINPEEIKVEFTDFPSEDAANAYGMSDNNSSQGGTYDEQMLRQIMSRDESFYDSKRTGFTEKELKAFRLSTQNDMTKLENIDLEGGTDQVGEFMIITFDNAGIVKRFKEVFQIPQTERKIDYNHMHAALSKEYADYISPDDASSAPF